MIQAHRVDLVNRPSLAHKCACSECGVAHLATGTGEEVEIELALHHIWLPSASTVSVRRDGGGGGGGGGAGDGGGGWFCLT